MKIELIKRPDYNRVDGLFLRPKLYAAYQNDLVSTGYTRLQAVTKILDALTEKPKVGKEIYPCPTLALYEEIVRAICSGRNRSEILEKVEHIFIKATKPK